MVDLFTFTVVQMDGLGRPEGSLRRKQHIKIPNSKTIKTTRPAMLKRKRDEISPDCG